MKAILETLCGAKREIEIPSPVKYYRQPLYKGISVMSDRNVFPELNMKVRTFELDYISCDSVAEYHEVWE